MPLNTTKQNRRRGDYDRNVKRKKIFVPALPSGIPAGAVEHNGTTTTTALFYAVGDQVAAFADLNSTRQVFPRLATQNDEVSINWKVPDDYYNGEDMFVWVVFAPDGCTTTSAQLSYIVYYDAKKVVDYGRKPGTKDTLTGEAATEASTAMDDAIDQDIYMDGLTKYAMYRGERGKISGSKVHVEDWMTFKIKCDAAIVDSAAMSIVGLEIDYALRYRNPDGTEIYFEE